MMGASRREVSVVPVMTAGAAPPPGMVTMMAGVSSIWSCRGVEEGWRRRREKEEGRREVEGGRYAGQEGSK